MASGPLTAPAGSGVSWQVDIPSLSQLILGAGSQGLKQLALAGVDIHAIGCMLMIGEYTPASTTFRQSLNRCRQAQRAERIWMYKVVEIGGGQSYLTDNLLNTRAGENVLALMTAIAAVMPEQACVTVLSKLFEVSGADIKDIPGLGQLTNIRNALLPMARKMDFKERVLKYHAFLWSLLQPGGPPSGSDPFDSILGLSSIPTVIEALHKIATTEEKLRMVYYGISGAAWVTTYACIVLGLEVCAIGKDGVPVPLSGTYENAKVIIDVSKKSRKCEVYKEDEIQSFITTEAITHNVRNGWSVDCSTFNFVEYNHPRLRDKQEFSRLCDFIAADTLNAISTLASQFTSFEKYQLYKGRESPPGFLSYTLSVLPEIHHRGLRILRLLGFSPQDITNYSFKALNDCATHTCLGSTANEKQYLKIKEKESALRCSCVELINMFGGSVGAGENTCDLQSCPCALANRGCTQYCHSLEVRDVCKNNFPILDMERGRYMQNGAFGLSKDPFLERLIYYMDPLSERSNTLRFSRWNTHLLREISLTARRAIEFASKLAFTDWDTSIRLMSARFVRSRPMNDRNNPEPLSTGNHFEGHLADAILLCTDSIDAITLETRHFTDDWLAYDLDGIVVLRNMALTRSIRKLKGKFLTFVPGRIHYEDMSCSSIRSDNVHKHAPINHVEHPSSEDWVKKSDFICPPTKSVTTDLKFHAYFSAVKDTLWIRLEVFFRGKVRGIAEPSTIAKTIPQLLVSVDPHGPVSVVNRPHHVNDPLPNPSVWAPGTVRKWHDGFSLDAQPEGGLILDLKYGAHVYNQCVSEDPEGQWLACQWPALESSKSFIVLRRDCCLTCVLRNLHPLILQTFSLSSDDPVNVCIITGNEIGEASRRCLRLQNPDLSKGMTALDPTLRPGYYESRKY